MTLADLLITTLVLPASSVAILGQMEDSENICRLQYGVGSMSCLTAAIFTAAIGIENFLRLKSLCHSEKNRERQLREQELRRSQSSRQSQSQTSPAHASHSHGHSHHHMNPHYQHHGLGHGLHHHNQHSASASPHHSYYHNNTNHTTATTSFTTHPNQGQQQSQPPRAPSPPPPPPAKASVCSVFQVTLLNLKMWVVSGVIVLIHFIFLPQLLYAICGKSSQGATTLVGDLRIPKLPTPINQRLLLESISVLGVCLVSLICLGGLGFLKCAFIIRGWKKPKPYLTSREFALVASNCWNCLLRFLIWAPSLITVIMIQFGRSMEEAQRLTPLAYDYTGRGGGRVSSGEGAAFTFDMSSPVTLALSEESSSRTTTVFSLNNEYSFLHRLLMWPMILPSCLSSLVNIITNRDFRRCYVQLFHYCCCKTSVALSGRPRESTRASSDVRVHIIPGYNMYSAHNEVSAPQPRFATFKFGPHRSASSGGGKRDVYEL